MFSFIRNLICAFCRKSSGLNQSNLIKLPAIDLKEGQWLRRKGQYLGLDKRSITAVVPTGGNYTTIVTGNMSGGDKIYHTAASSGQVYQALEGKKITWDDIQ